LKKINNVTLLTSVRGEFQGAKGQFGGRLSKYNVSLTIQLS